MQHDLTGRTASCAYGCGVTATSSERLAFFKYRGEGSEAALSYCLCGYALAAHIYPHVAAKCDKPAPRGPHETDSFYCGCRGWD